MNWATYDEPAHLASGNPPRPEVRYHIDYSTDRGKTWEPLVKDWAIPRRSEEPRALALGDALAGAAVAKGGAHAHFGEHHGRTFFGDEIDFAQTAAPVALDHAQSGALQQFRAEVFRSHARRVHGSLNGTAHPAVDRMKSGILYVIATPIGNLGDSSPRSIGTLRAA